MRSPRFQLEEAQVKAIVASLREEPTADSDKVLAAKTLTAFHCIACHTRDEFGGVHDTHNPFFAGSELKLGTTVASRRRSRWSGPSYNPPG